MSIITKLYDILPVPFQNLMCSVKGWMICNRRYGKGFRKELDLYIHKRLDGKELLRDFLLLTEGIKGYEGILSKEDYKKLATNEVSPFEMLVKFPILDKQNVKQFVEDFTNKAYIEPKIIMHTSGTTGSGLIFPYSVEMENKQWAVWWRYRMGLGLTLDTWCGWFGGRTIINATNKKPPYWRINKPGKQVMFSSYHLTKETIASYADEILKRNLIWLHGYPSSIAQVASLMIDNNIEPVDCVKIITTGAENLYDYQIAIISKAFPNAIVRQHYGLTEGVANFSQDKDGSWHTDDDFCHVELIPISNDNPNVCRIVGTGFSNYAFPLVRYDTGDIANVEYTEDGIGIVSFDGRKEDYVTLPDGVKLGRLDHIFKDCINVKEAQIYQKSIDTIIFRIVRGTHYSSDDEKLLKKEIIERFPSSVKTEIEYLNSIPRTKSGKLRLVISDVNK